jgi:hypothetical protein
LKRIGDYLLIGMIFLLGACSENEPFKSPNSEEYFPLQIGQYWIYNVTQTVYKEVEPKEANSVFELKSEVVDAFENLEGGVTYVIHDSKRANSEGSWEYYQTWSAKSDEFKVVITESNVPYIQLTFPLYKNKSWDGNKLNTKEYDEYVVQSIGQNYRTSSVLQFNDCVVINEENYSDDVEDKDERLEIYARNVGLVYKKKIFLLYCNDGNFDFGCSGKLIISSGEEWIQELKSYGQN